MTLFLGGAAALIALAAVLLLAVARRPRAADLDDPNLSWLRQRRAELEQSADPALLDDLGLRLLEEQGERARSPASVPTGRPRRLAALLMVVLVPLSAFLYLRLGALDDVLIYRQLENLESGDSAALARLTDAVRLRSAQRPDNLYYLDLLGQLQLGAEDTAGAAESFRRLAMAAPEDARAQAQAAQLMFIAAGRRLSDDARFLAERALALDPRQGTALGLLGMASFEAGQYQAAVQYWERLQALEEPGSEGYRLLGEVIETSRQRSAGTAPPIASEETSGPGITVALTLPDGVQVEPSATVFVFARAPSSAGRMPVAARRLTAAELPITLRLSDADAMAGQRLSEAGDVVVSAQLSRNGQPGEANAAFRGDSPRVTAGSSPDPVRIELRPVESG